MSTDLDESEQDRRVAGRSRKGGFDSAKTCSSKGDWQSRSRPAGKSFRALFLCGERGGGCLYLLKSGYLASESLKHCACYTYSDAVERLVETGWPNRAAQLTKFVEAEGWMWSTGQFGQMRAEKLLAWMKSPKPAHLKRYFSYWNIADVFGEITRRTAHRERLWLLVGELVDKRNNIAHGDTGAVATTLDVRRYMKTVKTFCGRADRALARAIARQCKVERPW